MLFIADFIGKKGDTQVTNVDLSSDKVAAYGAYSSGRLARIALVNMNYWVGPTSHSNPRPSQIFQLRVPSGVAHVLVKYLTSPSKSCSGATLQ